VVAGREAPHKKGVGLMALCPLAPMVRPLLAPGQDSIYEQLDLTLFPAHRHLGVGRRRSGGEGSWGPTHVPSS
jgi:hypothetical protein